MDDNSKLNETKGQNVRKCAAMGDLATLEKIGRYNPDALQEVDDLGWNVLHDAVRSGNVAVAKLLIELGMDKDQLTKDGQSPLRLARYFLSDRDPTSKYLESIGALDSQDASTENDL